MRVGEFTITLTAYYVYAGESGLKPVKIRPSTLIRE